MLYQKIRVQTSCTFDDQSLRNRAQEGLLVTSYASFDSCLRFRVQAPFLSNVTWQRISTLLKVQTCNASIGSSDGGSGLFWFKHLKGGNYAFGTVHSIVLPDLQVLWHCVLLWPTASNHEWSDLILVSHQTHHALPCLTYFCLCVCPLMYITIFSVFGGGSLSALPAVLSLHNLPWIVTPLFVWM